MTQSEDSSFFNFVGILLIFPILSQCKNIKIGATVKLRRQIHLFIFSQGEAASGSCAEKKKNKKKVKKELPRRLETQTFLGVIHVNHCHSYLFINLFHTFFCTK